MGGEMVAWCCCWWQHGGCEGGAAAAVTVDGGDDDDDGVKVVLVLSGGCGSRRGGGMRVEARGKGDRIDRKMGTNFAFGRKSPPENFSGGGDVAVAEEVGPRWEKNRLR
ncbi:hypothetical protein Tco_0622822 [Tanacetum coccineum]